MRIENAEHMQARRAGRISKWQYKNWEKSYCRWCEHQKYTVSSLSKILPRPSLCRLTNIIFTHTQYASSLTAGYWISSLKIILQITRMVYRPLEEKWFFFVSHIFGCHIWNFFFFFFVSFDLFPLTTYAWVVLTYTFPLFLFVFNDELTDAAAFL